MAVLKNKTQKNFTMISNNVLRDKELKLIDRGLLCTLCSLPDGWEFSVAGMSSIVPDGKSAITSAMKRLEEHGYVKRTKGRDSEGKFVTEIEISLDKNAMNTEVAPNSRDRFSVTDNPSRINRHGKSVAI